MERKRPDTADEDIEFVITSDKNENGADEPAADFSTLYYEEYHKQGFAERQRSRLAAYEKAMKGLASGGNPDQKKE